MGHLCEATIELSVDGNATPPLVKVPGWRVDSLFYVKTTPFKPFRD